MRSLYRALNGCHRRGQPDQPQWNAPAVDRLWPSSHPRRRARLHCRVEPAVPSSLPSSGRHDLAPSTCSDSTCVTSSARLKKHLLLQPVQRQQCVAKDAKRSSSRSDLPSPFIPTLTDNNITDVTDVTLPALYAPCSTVYHLNGLYPSMRKILLLNTCEGKLRKLQTDFKTPCYEPNTVSTPGVGLLSAEKSSITASALIQPRPQVLG